MSDLKDKNVILQAISQEIKTSLYRLDIKQKNYSHKPVKGSGTITKI